MWTEFFRVKRSKYEELQETIVQHEHVSQLQQKCIKKIWEEIKELEARLKTYHDYCTTTGVIASKKEKDDE